MIENHIYFPEPENRDERYLSYENLMNIFYDVQYILDEHKRILEEIVYALKSLRKYTFESGVVNREELIGRIKELEVSIGIQDLEEPKKPEHIDKKLFEVE